jgi:hypothetical protein
MKSKAIFVALVALGALVGVWAMNNVQSIGKLVGPKTNG